MRVTTGCIVSTLFGAAAVMAADNTQPYAGQQQRPIKALSHQQVQDYRAGKGMGFAKAAELNHYPGPRHVLDLADELQLTAGQRQASQELFNTMQAEAQPLGEQIVAAERRLEDLFADGLVDETNLRAAVQQVAQLQGEVRYAHLRTHLTQRALLTEQQVRHYDQLRGYGQGGSSHAHQH